MQNDPLFAASEDNFRNEVGRFPSLKQKKKKRTLQGCVLFGHVSLTGEKCSVFFLYRSGHDNDTGVLELVNNKWSFGEPFKLGASSGGNYSWASESKELKKLTTNATKMST